jgi:dienelactone hydrolase
MAMKPAYQTYYDSRRQLHERLLACGRRMGVKARSAEEFAAWATAARAKYAELLGLAKMTPVPANARITASADCGDYVREHWLMETEPHVTMPFYLLRPKGAAGARPAVICPHGHGGGGKAAVAGVADIPEVAEAIGKFNYAYGVEFVRAGLLAFCPDVRGFGERQEPEVRAGPLDCSCHLLQVMGAPQGIPVMGMMTFDLMRLLDHMQKRPDVIPSRIGCAGLSGGGWQTLSLSALDRRVACAVVSGYFYGVAESLLELPGNCSCNVVPGMWEYFDMGDLGAMIAPRPLLVESGDRDDLNGKGGLDNVYPQVRIASAAYGLLGAGDRIYHDVFHGPHRWHGLLAVPWMKEWLTQAPPGSTGK